MNYDSSDNPLPFLAFKKASCRVKTKVMHESEDYLAISGEESLPEIPSPKTFTC